MKEITKEILESVVPDRIFWRGEDLYNEGAVQNVDVSENQIAAKVLGTRLYTVKSEKIEDDFLFSCTCPYEGFCKHRIALGLWITENKSALSKMKAKQDSISQTPDITALLKTATINQKNKFLTEALSEFPVLLSRFEVMIKGAEKLGGDIDIDCLVNEIKTKMEEFDLEEYERFYDSAPDRYGYREEWEVLQDGAESEFDEIFERYKDRALELLEIHNVIGSFKYLLAIYEAVKTANFESIDDPACIYEGEDLHDLAETNLEQLLREFTFGFAALSFEESVYMQLIDVYFDRFAISAIKQIYHISDFTDLFLSCLKTENIAVHLSGLLRNNSSLPEEDYCELLLAVYEKVDDKEKWLDIAEKYYKTDQAVAEKLLNHFVNHKGKLIQLAQDIAFHFDEKFIPFFYENLKKEDNPELFKKILFKHAEKSQTVNLYREIKDEYGEEAAWEFINSLAENWDTEKFYIQLLKEEKAYEKLLSLAHQKSDTYPAMSYLRPIVNVYPDQVFKIISMHAEKFLDENTGRNYYRQAAEWLRLFEKITDKKTGKEAAKFIKHLLDKFSNRRAMKDEFKKTGVA